MKVRDTAERVAGNHHVASPAHILVHRNGRELGLEQLGSGYRYEDAVGAFGWTRPAVERRVECVHLVHGELCESRYQRQIDLALELYDLEVGLIRERMNIEAERFGGIDDQRQRQQSRHVGTGFAG